MVTVDLRCSVIYQLFCHDHVLHAESSSSIISYPPPPPPLIHLTLSPYFLVLLEAGMHSRNARRRFAAALRRGASIPTHAPVTILGFISMYTSLDHSRDKYLKYLTFHEKDKLLNFHAIKKYEGSKLFFNLCLLLENVENVQP